MLPEYLAGEEERNTPCTPGGAYDRLKDCGGKILLVGVGQERNTHPQCGRGAECSRAGGGVICESEPRVEEGKKYIGKHYNPDQPHISEDFVKLNQAFLDCGAVEVVTFGDAKCLLCDAQKVFRWYGKCWHRIRMSCDETGDFCRAVERIPA